MKLIKIGIVHLFWSSGDLYRKATCAMNSFPTGTIFHLEGTLESQRPEWGSGGTFCSPCWGATICLPARRQQLSTSGRPPWGRPNDESC